MGFPHLELHSVKSRESLKAISSPVSLPRFLFTSFPHSSEDLKGPETKPQLVGHEYHAHLRGFSV